MKRAIAISLFATLAVCATSNTAFAYNLVDDEEMTLKLGGLFRGGYQASSVDADFAQGPYIQTARLSGGFDYKGIGGAFVQLDGQDAVVRVLDAYAELRPVEQIAVRAGIYRLPTTADFLVGIPVIPFANRSMLVGMTYPRMLGTELLSTFSSDTLSVNARLGFFQANAAERDLLPDGEGTFFSARVGLEFDFGLGFHLAYLGLVFGDNAPVPTADDPMILVRPVTYPEVFDAAITYRKDGLDLALEGLLAPDVPDGQSSSYAAYFHGAYRFGISDVVDLGPGARYGIRTENDVQTHKVTAGVTTYFNGTGLKIYPNYELTVQDDIIGHTGLATVQGQF